MKSKCIFWAVIIAFALVPINPAYAADTSPPQIVDWQLSESQPKLIPNGATFSSTFVVSDESSVDLPELYLQSTSTSQKSQFAQVTLIKKIGNLASYKATVLLSKDSAPKEWMWMFASLRDEFGNIQTNTQSLNLVVNAFNESFTASDFFYSIQISNAKESYLRNVRLLDKYASRLEDLLKKYPKDPGLLLAKIKQPDFPRTPPEGEEVIQKVESTGGSLQMFLDEIELAYSRILITEGAEASQVRITAAKSKYSALSLEIESLIKKYPSKKSEIELYKKKIALFERIDQTNISTVELNLAGIESKLVAMRSIYSKIATTITCTKGKKSLKVVDVKPKCPAGYRKK